MENYCKICKKNYSSIRTFRNHNKIFHPTEIITIERNDNKLRRFSCEKCNKNFTSKQNMQLHIMNSCKKNQYNTPIEKKYFFENLLYKSVFRMEQLYQKYKKTTPLLFNKAKQEQIEEDISTLKAIRDRDMNDILLKEMLKKLNLLSYNYRQTILNTWNNCDTIGCKAKTFEEDLEESDSDDIKEIDDLFIKADYDDNEDSESDKPVLELKNKKKELNV